MPHASGPPPPCGGTTAPTRPARTMPHASGPPPPCGGTKGMTRLVSAVAGRTDFAPGLVVIAADQPLDSGAAQGLTLTSRHVA